MSKAQDLSRMSLRRDQVLEFKMDRLPQPQPQMLKLPGLAQWWAQMELSRERDTQAIYRLVNNLSESAMAAAGGGDETNLVEEGVFAVFRQQLPLTTYGDILSRNATSNVRIGIGLEGQVLTAHGAGALPTWETPTPVGTPGTGTVTSVAMTVPGFLTVTGSPITTAGTLDVSLSGVALPISSGGTGQTTALAAFDALSPLTTFGDLLSRDASNNVRIGIGTTGHVLTSNGAGALPSWQAASSAGAPADATYVTLTTNATLTNERVLTGTSNQVIITDGGAGAAVTLSLPQSIHTGASPVFLNLSVTSLALELLSTNDVGEMVITVVNSPLLYEPWQDPGTPATLSIQGLSSIGLANQIPGTNAAADAWEYKTLTDGQNITINHAAGSIEFAVSGILPITNGGTAQDGSSFQDGGITFFSAADGIIKSDTSQLFLDVGSQILSINTHLSFIADNTWDIGADGATRPKDLYLGTVTDFSFLFGDSGGRVGSTAAADDGEILIGSTGSAPVKATLTAGTNITITNAAGSITIDSTGGGGTNALLDGTAHTDTVAQAVTRGSLIYGNSTPKWDELVIGATARVLRSNGTDVSWAQVVLTTDVTNTLPAVNGGTGQPAYAVGDILYASGTFALSRLTAVATGNALISGGLITAPLWGKIGLSTHVSGTLPVANGGTNAGAFTLGSVVFAGASGTYTQDNANFFWDDTNNNLCVGTNTGFSDSFGTARLTVSGRLGVSGTIHLPTTASSSLGCIIQNSVVVFHTYAESGTGNNIFIGNPVAMAGNFSTTGIGANVGIGANCLVGLTTGTRNMGLGGSCLQQCTTGANNCAVGEASLFGVTTGNSNTGIGQSAGRALTTGNQNTFIGDGAGYNNGTQATPGNVTNSGAIGFYAQVSGSNMFCIGSLFAGFEWNVGINMFTPTARFHLPAGVAAASSAPLKFTTGTSMTTAEAGAMEYTTDNLFFTISTGTARKRILFADAVGGLTSTRVPFATTNGRLTDAAALTWASDTLQLGVPSATTGTIAFAHASSAHLTKIVAGNASTAETYILPTTDGSSGQFLSTNGSGVLSWAAATGVSYTSVTAVSNSGSAQTDLWNQTIDANVLNATGDALHFRLSGSINTSVNNKELQVSFGATTFFSSLSRNSLSGEVFVITGSITRDGASSQLCEGSMTTSTGTVFQFASSAPSAETTTGTITFKLTGQGGASGEINFKVGRIWFVPG